MILLSEVAKAVNGQPRGVNPGADIELQSIGIDSRHIVKNQLFIAIKGKYFDGNTFARDAIKQGAVFRYLIESPDQLPGAGEDPLAFQFEIDRIVVESGRDGRGARDVGVEREDEGHGCGRENALRRVSRL